MGHKRAKIGECIYCGNITEIHVDHIPPKNLFAKPRPGNLITVPSCLACNNGASSDDEYLWTRLAFRADTYEHPDIQSRVLDLTRSFARPEKAWVVADLIENMEQIEVETIGTPGTHSVEKVPAVQISMEPIRRVLQRITQGLYYHETTLRLPPEYDVHSVMLPGGSHLYDKGTEEIDAIFKPLWDNVLPHLQKSKRVTIGNNVFTYRYFRLLDEDPHVSGWLYLFFGAVPAFCFTMNGKVQRARRRELGL